jgi:Sulfotransferase family
MVESQSTGQSRPRSTRSRAPVFVLGSHRSGTKLLYYSLLSAGGFAVFPEESAVYTVLSRHFGDLSVRGNRRKMLDTYCNSAMFLVTGLDPKDFQQRVMEECSNAGDLLRIQMEMMARNQGVERWAESTPKHLLSLPLIKSQIPDALVVHIIRDGRDATASLYRSNRYRPLPWDKSRHYLACAMFWRYLVGKGREYGRAMGPDYMEVHYEEMVENPRETLARVGKFIDQDLDYDRIQRVALGSVQHPNSSFQRDSKEAGASTMGRWKRVFTPEQVRNVEWCIGDLLVETGYKLETPVSELRAPLSVHFMNFLYPLYLKSRHWLKWHTPFARLEDRRGMTVAPAVSSADSASQAEKAAVR